MSRQIAFPSFTNSHAQKLLLSTAGAAVLLASASASAVDITVPLAAGYSLELAVWNEPSNTGGGVAINYANGTYPLAFGGGLADGFPWAEVIADTSSTPLPGLGATAGYASFNGGAFAAVCYQGTCLP